MSETKPCTHCNGTGQVEAPKPRQSVPITEREWTLYQDDGVTSIIRALSPNLVAVARSFTAPEDRYSKKKGRAIAQARMRNLIEEYFNKGTKHYGSQHGRQSRASYDDHVIFEVVPPNELTEHEEMFFNDVILKRFETEVEHES